MDKKEYADKLKSELLDVARKLINDDIPLIEGVRIIKHNLELSNLNEEDMNLIRAIDSDTDDVPVGDTRKMWSQDALKQLDSELADYIKEIKPKVIEVCKRIIANLTRV